MTYILASKSSAPFSLVSSKSLSSLLGSIAPKFPAQLEEVIKEAGIAIVKFESRIQRLLAICSGDKRRKRLNWGSDGSETVFPPPKNKKILE